jgi:hypothetical protein
MALEALVATAASQDDPMDALAVALRKAHPAADVRVTP